MSAEQEAPPGDRSDDPNAERYAWPGGDEDALEVTCARIARHVALAHPRTVGFLPIGGGGRPGGSLREQQQTMSLAPLLSRVAGKLIGFVTDDVAIVDSWRTWTPASTPTPAAAKDAGKDGAAAGAASRIHEIQPRVLDVMPPACRDATAAAAALRNTLAILRRTVSIVLVHLGGYAATGVVPATLNLVDGVVMVVLTRRTRRSAVATLAEQLPSAKQLGAVLVG